MNDLWKRVSIKDVCDSIVDCINRTAPTVEEPTKYKMIRTTNVRSGWVNLSKVRYVTKETYKKWTRRAVPKKGDIILTREAPLGEVGMLRENDNVFLGQRLVQYRADFKKLDNRFLLYSLQGKDLQGQIKALGSGATVEHMRVPDAKKLTLLLPPIDIQKKIASILSAYDDLIENNNNRIKILEKTSQSLYREWFVNFRFPGYEDVRMVKSEFGMIPEGWECKYPNYVDFLEGPGLRTYQYTEEGIPFLNIRTLVHNDIDMSKVKYLDEEEVKTRYSHFLLKSHDHVVSSSGTLGRIVTIQPEHLPIMLNTSIIRMRPKKESLGKWQLKHFIKSDYFQNQINKYATGAAQKNYGPSHLKKMKIIAPNREIGQMYEELVSPLEHLIINLVGKNRNLRKIRDLLLPKLISGEIDVGNLDINTEGMKT